MADWLRHFGQRPKTPDGPEGNFSSPSKLSHHLSPSRRLRAPAIRHISSRLSLAPSESNASTTQSAPAIASFMTTHSDTGSFKSIPDEYHVNLDSASHPATSVRPGKPEQVFLREADRTWHTPSLEQIIDSLQVVMMTKPGPLEPIPIQYNSHVLVLLEGYRKLQDELKETRETAAKEVGEVKALRMRELESWRSMSEDWLEREKGYMAEVKRLELLLAEHTKEGMAMVTLARAGSVVARGAIARKGFEERVKRLSRGDDGDALEVTSTEAEQESSPLEKQSRAYKHVGAIPLNIDPDHDRRLSQQLAPKSKISRKHRHPSKGEKSKKANDTTEVQDPAGTYLPTGVPPSENFEDSPRRARKNIHPMRPDWYIQSADSSSSSSSVSRSSSLSSDRSALLSKGKHVHCPGEPSDTSSRPSTEVSQPPATSAGMATSKFRNRTYRGLAIERFLTIGVMDQEADEHGSDRSPASQAPAAIEEDYFSQPRANHQRKRARGFSFLAGVDDSLPVSPMALPPPMRPDNDELVTSVSPSSSPRHSETTQTSQEQNIKQPRPHATASLAKELSVARQLHQSITPDRPKVNAAATVAGQPRPSHFASTAITTPSSLARPNSTGSVISVAQPSTGGSHDSTGSRVTMLRDNSGRASRRQSSQSNTTSDDPSSPPSPAMSPIPERENPNLNSPTPVTRGGKKRSGKRRSHGQGSTTSSPAMTPRPSDAGPGLTIPFIRPMTPASARPTPPRRQPSIAGGSEAATQAARIAAAMAVERGKRNA